MYIGHDDTFESRMDLMTKITAMVMFIFFTSAALAVEIEVLGLFSNAAMLRIDGESRLLKKGERSKEGVMLVTANSRKAVIEFEGKVQSLNLSDKIGTSFRAPEKAQVHVTMNKNRQYIAHGSVNGRSVRFLVDTGANVVAISSTMARSLGISLKDGQKSKTATASGMATSTIVTIAEMQVGDIRQTNVRAVVIDGDHPLDILLGMSFLQHVDITEKSGLMVLTSKM